MGARGTANNATHLAAQHTAAALAGRHRGARSCSFAAHPHSLAPSLPLPIPPPAPPVHAERLQPRPQVFHPQPPDLPGGQLVVVDGAGLAGTGGSEGGGGGGGGRLRGAPGAQAVQAGGQLVSDGRVGQGGLGGVRQREGERELRW